MSTLRSIALGLVFVTGSQAWSQWSADPDMPLLICDAAGIQNDLRSLPDGEGGWFVFWVDQRPSDNERSVYGQRVDADGYLLWEQDGRRIVYRDSVNVYGMEVCQLVNGDLMMLFKTGASGPGDSLFAMRIDTSGMAQWAEPTLLASRANAHLSLGSMAMVPSANGALVAYNHTVIGGSGRRYVDRVRNDGSLVVGENGELIDQTGGSPLGIAPTSDHGGIVHWRNGNGSGTHMGAMRIDSLCNFEWAGTVDPVAGTNGLSYVYRAIGDGQDGLAIVFVEATNPRQIRFTRLDGNGDAVTTPAIKTVGGFSSSQDEPWITRQDGHFNVGWQDNRPPANNADLYMQRLDMNGDPLWDPAGELIFQVQTYIPHSRHVPTDSSGLIVTQLTSLDGFRAQRVRSDGTTAWMDDAVLGSDQVVPFYDAFEMHRHADGGAVAFWYNTDDQDIHAAHVNFYGSTGITSGVPSSQPLQELGLVVAPVPSTGTIELLGPVPPRFRSVLFDASGRRVLEVVNGRVLDLGALPAGPYHLRVQDLASGAVQVLPVVKVD